MITDFDRSGWVGASDIRTLLTSRRTKKVTLENGEVVEKELASWSEFKAIKLGLLKTEQIKTLSMTAGDMYEEPILRHYNEDVEWSKTIYVPEYALRVNLDGNTKDYDNPKIIEIKTYNAENGGISSTLMKQYYYQVQTQAFAWEYEYGKIPTIELRSYALQEDDYEAVRQGYTLPLDENRIESKIIEYDEYFVNYKLKPALKEFADWLNPVMGR